MLGTRELFKSFKCFVQERREIAEASRTSKALGNIENFLLRLVEYLFQFASFVETEVREMLGCLDELSHHKFLHHDLGIMLGVGRRGNRRRKFREESGSTNALEKLFFFQPCREREDVDRRVFAEEFHHRFKDYFVLVEIERSGRNDIEHFVDHIRPEHNRTNESHLRLHRVRRDSQAGIDIGRTYDLHPVRNYP